MNKLSQQVYDYISDTSNYDMEDVLERITSDIPDMKGLYVEDCSIMDGDLLNGYVMALDDYTREVFKKTCEMVVNVIESFEERAE